jgi:hypothetical protein
VKAFEWKELSRDINSIYLQDSSGLVGATARIDLHFGTIVYCPSLQIFCYDLRTITDAHRINSFGLNAQDLSKAIVANGNQWVFRGNKVWEEVKVNGQRPTTWKETGRDVHSVFLEDNDRQPGTTARIDLHLGEILYCPRLGTCFTLHDITAAYP